MKNNLNQSEQQLNVAFCIRCGQNLSGSHKFCPNCGNTVEIPQSSENYCHKKRKSILIILISILVVLSVAGTAYYFLQDSFSGGYSSSKSNSKKDSDNENVEKDGYSKLRNYIIENGVEDNGAYHLMRESNGSNFIMTVDEDCIYWALINPGDEESTITNMKLERNSKIQSINTDMTFKDGTPGFSLYGDIITSEFRMNSPEIYDFGITTSLLDENDCLPLFETICKFMFSLAEETIKDADITMDELGFTSLWK